MDSAPAPVSEHANSRKLLPDAVMGPDPTTLPCVATSNVATIELVISPDAATEMAAPVRVTVSVMNASRPIFWM
jgi:hypothetical protein